MKVSTAGEPAPSAAGTAWGATDSNGSGEWMRASSSRLPPQRTRGERAVARRSAMQLAAKGRSRRAATCASTSLPLVVPAATTARRLTARSITSSTAVAQAPGA